MSSLALYVLRLYVGVYACMCVRVYACMCIRVPCVDRIYRKKSVSQLW